MERTRTLPTKLRFAVITDGLAVPRWAARCLDRLDRSGLASLVLVMVLPPVGRPRERGGRIWLLAKYGGWVRLRSPSLLPVKNLSLLSRAEIIRCSPEISRHGFVLNPLDAETVRQSGLDFILHFSRRILRGAICDAARHGLWIFSHGEEERHGRFPGFGEVMRGDAVTSAALQRLEADGSTIDLVRGFLRTRKNYRHNTEALRLASAGWCLQICRRISLGQQPAAEAAGAPSPGLAVMPTIRCLGRYFARRIGAAGIAIWRKLFFLDMWNIGIVASPLRQVVTTGRAKPVSWLHQPGKLHFFADPFPVEVGRQLYLLFEEFDHLKGKGWISGAVVRDNLDLSTEAVFVAPCHMSYPFLLEAEGKLFCVPETSEAGVILLFEACSFPSVWKEPVVIAEGFAALDSTIFAHEGKWWLFCTNAAAAPEEELHAWYSEELRGPWYPHPLNPLCCDVRSARPAGSPFMLDGVLMRPGQDCSRTYGGAVSLMRIDALTPTDFRETRIGAVLPDSSGPYPDGLHTIVGIGDITVIDGKRRMFSPIALPLKLLCKLRRLKRLARAKGARETFIREFELGARPAE
jgi:hypothetical protein